MAANSCYNAHAPAANEQQQHLLAYASPLSDQFSQPSTPLKPLHLVAQNAYHHANSSVEKHEDLQHALQEDAVRTPITPKHKAPTLTHPAPQIPHPPLPPHLPHPQHPGLHRRTSPPNHDGGKVPRNKRHLPHRHLFLRRNLPHSLAPRLQNLAHVLVLWRRSAVHAP